MPPHCDSLDGPVVRAAMKALDEGDVDLVLPFVKGGRRGRDRAVLRSRSMAARAGGPRHVRSPTCTSSRPRCGSIGAARTPSVLPARRTRRWTRHLGGGGGHRIGRPRSAALRPHPRRGQASPGITSWRCAPPSGRECLKSESTSRPCWDCRCGPTWFSNSPGLISACSERSARRLRRSSAGETPGGGPPRTGG